MARVPYLDKQDLAPENQDLLARGINLFRALVHSPNGARRVQAIGQYIRHGSRLDPRLREMAILQVGYLTRSRYEYSHHIKISRDFGVSDADIRSIIAETAGGTTTLEPLVKAVLRAAREMTRDLAVSDATYAALKSGLDAECLIDLIITIGYYNSVVRVLATLQIDVEDDYLHYLNEFPLPKD
ncbi:MAG: carboxymuconolactone decarboxylase family protein [Alphaproteobacteria bacterium]